MTFAVLLPVLLSLGLSGSIGDADLRRLAEVQLPRTLGADSLRWSLAYPWASLRVPAGATDVRLVPPAGEPRPGIAACELEVLRDGQVLRAASVALRCERVGAGVRLRRALPAGSVLETTDLVPVRGALPVGERPLDEAEAAVGRRLRRSLAADAWLTASCVERVPLIKHGETLQVSAETSSLVIRFQAVAQQEGALGEVIRARGPRACSLIKVKVTGDGLADLVP